MPQDVSRRDPRFFLLEDDHLNALILREYLATAGHEDVTWARSLSEAETHSEALAAGAFDIAILDITLSDGESWAVAQQIKDTGRTKLCAYTARFAGVEAARLAEIGFDATFFKPVELDGFLEEIARLIDSLEAAA